MELEREVSAAMRSSMGNARDVFWDDGYGDRQHAK